MAPEVIRRHAYDEQTDLWSLGTVVYVMLTGCFPFTREELMQWSSDDEVRGCGYDNRSTLWSEWFFCITHTRLLL